jgi:hypothetical protein
MNELLQRLNDLVHRHQQVIFDLRGNCRVLYGIAVPFRYADDAAMEASSVIADALQQDGLITVSREPLTGAITFMRCRLFTAPEQAMRFAHEQGQVSFYNLNRACDVTVPFSPPSEHAPMEAVVPVGVDGGRIQ